MGLTIFFRFFPTSEPVTILLSENYLVKIWLFQNSQLNYNFFRTHGQFIIFIIWLPDLNHLQIFLQLLWWNYHFFRNTLSHYCFSRTLPTRAGEPVNFLAAPAPDFFFKRLRLLIFSPSGFSSWFFFKRLRLQGAKNTWLRPAPAPDYWLSLPKYSFPHKLVR